MGVPTGVQVSGQVSGDEGLGRQGVGGMVGQVWGDYSCVLVTDGVRCRFVLVRAVVTGVVVTGVVVSTVTDVVLVTGVAVDARDARGALVVGLPTHRGYEGSR